MGGKILMTLVQVHDGQMRNWLQGDGAKKGQVYRKLIGSNPFRITNKIQIHRLTIFDSLSASS